MREKITIVGAGIGGLTTALALEQAGFEVEIFEQAPTLKTVGAGIILANNAMQVYRNLGLDKALSELGNRLSVLRVTNHHLKPLSSIHLEAFENEYGVSNIAIHRADLQQLLVSQLKNSQIHLGKKLKTLQEDLSGIALFFQDGSQHKAKLVLGADGIHSAVRTEITTQSNIRQARQICWRGVLDFKLPPNYYHEFNEAWGKGCRFGFGQINDTQVYWFALANFKESIEEYKGFSWRKIFDNFHPLIQELLASTPDEQVFTAEITDLKHLSRWSKDRICLIGDAAHATTPNMGQGAGQAIEDALLISQCLEKYPVDQAFERFREARFKKVKMVVNNSWNIGKMAQLENPFLILLRNSIMRLSPDFLNTNQVAKVFELNTLEF